ncbi:hypothetical protein FLJC2902T_10650 [Flavobacterium limnosediminis JC2902]|uniref:Mucoidy inhibitor MuiA family protein n=1 Tax=Flavobacterium limnosediminis JC2902 TaxID=1341181 RepID=V6SX79_9FLAO|nr:DUF4139 domain-containing protein [Flavobacterium limnosediminis]ESU29030.1 hypothetical protein FLJC2902T_10650 [Flavobacterium limnosediminis JC2902]
MKQYFSALLILATGTLFAQKPIFTNAKVKSATVYFNAAEISQNTTVNLPAGTSEIVVKNVANFLNESSVQIGAPSTITVLSVQFTNDYISEYDADGNSPAIKTVKDSILLVEKEIDKVINMKNSENKTIELLDKNQQVFGQNSGLSVAELMKMVEYYKAKRTEISNNVNTLTEKEEKLNKTLERLNNKLEINTEKEEKTSTGKLVLQVMNTVAGNVPLEISYLTNNAGWTPFYDLRADNVASPINMMYKAQVIQNTGVDWKKVKLTLSSGMPNQNNQAPTVNPWFLRYLNPQAANPNVVQSLNGSVAGLQVNAPTGQKTKIVLRGNRSISGNSQALVVIDGQISTAEILQQLPPETIKSTNILKGAQGAALYGDQGVNGVIVVTTKQGMGDYTSISENQLNISFDIDIPYDIVSNGKKHSVALKEIKLPASYKYYAAPKLDKEAFLLSEITDYGKYNLLKGEANIIFEGIYVGKTWVNPGQTSDTLNLSMGRDKKVSIKREKVADKSGTKFLSSKKEQTFTYDIIIRNNKKETASIKVEDQIPLSTDKEIEIEVKDKDGAKMNSETGLLIWEISLKPNETKKIRLSYLVKYPKDKTIENL